MGLPAIDLSGNARYVPPLGTTPSPAGIEATYTFAANDTTAPIRISGKFAVGCAGTFGSGTVSVERSIDDGITWRTTSRDSAGNAASYTAPFDFSFSEPNRNSLFRFVLTGSTSPAITIHIKTSPRDYEGNA